MKMIKALSKISLLLLLTAFVFTACKKDEAEPEVIVDDNEIVGRWQLSSIAPETAGTTIPAIAVIVQNVPCIYQLVFAFESNNKVTPSGCDLAIAGLTSTGYLTVGSATTWKVENNSLKLTNGTTTQTLPLKQNGDEMTITVNTNLDTTTPAVNALLVFKRI